MQQNDCFIKQNGAACLSVDEVVQQIFATRLGFALSGLANCLAYEHGKYYILSYTPTVKHQIY